MNLDQLIFEELKLQNANSIYDIYPDFNWTTYKNLNPYLYIIGLRTEKEYTYNYLVEGRYKGRNYKNTEIFSLHILIATLGKNNIFNILKILKRDLTEIDYLTIVFDGEKSKNIDLVKKEIINFKCNVNIIVESKNLGFWGHGIRNKYNDLKGDFVYHIDDDDILYDDSFKIIRKYCNNKNIIYIFKIVLKNNNIIWKSKNIKINEISTQSGIIPTEFNKNSYWSLKYGGDFDFYKKLSNNYRMLFIDKVIYKKT